MNLQTERPRTYRVKLGSGRAAPIAGGLLGSAAPCPQAQERTWAGPRGRVPEKPRSPRATGFQGGEEERKGRRRREEGGEEEEEGEEGVIGRLRCEVSTFPAGETAKPPAVLPAAPGLPGSGGRGRWGFLQGRLAPWSPVIPELTDPDGCAPSFLSGSVPPALRCSAPPLRVRAGINLGSLGLAQGSKFPEAARKGGASLWGAGGGLGQEPQLHCPWLPVSALWPLERGVKCVPAGSE